MSLALLVASGLPRLQAEPVATRVADGDQLRPIVGSWLAQPEGVVGGSMD